MKHMYNNIKYYLNTIKILDFFALQIGGASHYVLDPKSNYALINMYYGFTTLDALPCSKIDGQSRLLIQLGLASPINRPIPTCRLSKIGQRYMKRYSHYGYYKFWFTMTRIGLLALISELPISLIMMFLFIPELISFGIMLTLLVIAFIPAIFPKPERIHPLTKLDLIDLLFTSHGYLKWLSNPLATDRFVFTVLNRAFTFAPHCYNFKKEP